MHLLPRFNEMTQNLDTSNTMTQTYLCRTEPTELLFMYGTLGKSLRTSKLFYLPKKKKAAAVANINYKTRLTRTKPITPSCPLAFGTPRHGRE